MTFGKENVMTKTRKPTDKQKRRLGSDLDKVDAHVITAEEYQEIPELTDEWVERADLYHDGKLISHGKSKADDNKSYGG